MLRALRATVIESTARHSARARFTVPRGHDSLSTDENGCSTHDPLSTRFFNRFSSRSPPSPSAGQPRNPRPTGIAFRALSRRWELLPSATVPPDVPPTARRSFDRTISTTRKMAAVTSSSLTIAMSRRGGSNRMATVTYLSRSAIARYEHNTAVLHGFVPDEFRCTRRRRRGGRAAGVPGPNGVLSDVGRATSRSRHAEWLWKQCIGYQQFGAGSW